MFLYSGQMDSWTDERTDGRMDRDINPVWASLTMFLQVKERFASVLIYMDHNMVFMLAILITMQMQCMVDELFSWVAHFTR
jgi:hypothetical protein